MQHLVSIKTALPIWLDGRFLSLCSCYDTELLGTIGVATFCCCCWWWWCFSAICFSGYGAIFYFMQKQYDTRVIYQRPKCPDRCASQLMACSQASAATGEPWWERLAKTFQTSSSGRIPPTQVTWIRSFNIFVGFSSISLFPESPAFAIKFLKDLQAYLWHIVCCLFWRTRWKPATY